MTSANEVAARWCYAELCSSRFGASYLAQGVVSQALVDKANNGVKFENWDGAEVTALQNALSLHNDRGPCFYPTIMQYQTYKLERWDYVRLSGVSVVPYFGSVTFRDFEGNPHPSVAATLATIPTGPFIQNEAVIVVPWNGRDVLIEGTLRSMLFARDRFHDTMLEVWYPA